MAWYNPDKGLWYHLPAEGYTYLPGFACFDLDWTLVKPAKGKFPNSTTDNIIMTDRISVLKDLKSKGYNVVVFTNQKLTPRQDLAFKIARMEDVISKFKGQGIDLLLFMSVLEDKYRKPNTGMWDYVVWLFKNQIDRKFAFYCGDAAGRSQDFSAQDIDFAKSIEIPFYVPEDLF